MSLLSKKERQQLELFGVEQQDKLPAPMWMQTLGSDAMKLLLLACFSIIALNIASAVIDREIQLQQQQKVLRGMK